MRSPRSTLRGSSLPRDWVRGVPGFIVSGSRVGGAGPRLGVELAGGGCELTRRDCWRAGGHRLGAARRWLATQLRGEAPPGTVRVGPADALGEEMDGPRAGAKRAPSPPPRLVQGKRRVTA